MIKSYASFIQNAPMIRSTLPNGQVVVTVPQNNGALVYLNGYDPRRVYTYSKAVPTPYDLASLPVGMSLVSCPVPDEEDGEDLDNYVTMALVLRANNELALVCYVGNKYSGQSNINEVLNTGSGIAITDVVSTVNFKVRTHSLIEPNNFPVLTIYFGTSQYTFGVETREDNKFHLTRVSILGDANTLAYFSPNSQQFDYYDSDATSIAREAYNVAQATRSAVESLNINNLISI